MENVQMSKNPFSKSVKEDKAYATYRVENPANGMYLEWKVLKTYKVKVNEDKDQYARWFCAVKSPMTDDSWELGDVYRKEIEDIGAVLIDATDEWREVYGA